VNFDLQTRKYVLKTVYQRGPKRFVSLLSVSKINFIPTLFWLSFSNDTFVSHAY
jgi:hypothetical protein